MKPQTEIRLQPGADQTGFKQAVRRLLQDDIPPDTVGWHAKYSGDLFAGSDTAPAAPLQLPRGFIDLASLVVCHREPARYAMLYSLIWRIRHGESHLLNLASDPLVHKLSLLARTIKRDLHKMHAFVRFRRVPGIEDEQFIAWFEPDHYIVEATANFFVKRFESLHWSILTQVGSLYWDRKTLTIGPPGDKSGLPNEDSFEEGWCTYYSSIFNPARLNPKMMRSEMAQKYWHNLPEAKLIPALIEAAPERVQAMVEQHARLASHRDPKKAVAAMVAKTPKTLAQLNDLIMKTDPFIRGGTRAVLGEGPTPCKIVFIGEQPGDEEDKAGRPFIGPAGRILDRALAQAGLERSEIYITNAVKHFKFTQQGKRRLHAKPTLSEVKHYRWWLMLELDFIVPDLIVTLGTTALAAMTGKQLTLKEHRHEISFGARRGFATIHPSYLLRLPDQQSQIQAYHGFVADLQRIKSLTLAAGQSPVRYNPQPE